MNRKLILQLSVFGLTMAFGTIYVIPSTIEPLFWLAVFVICAVLIAKRAPGRFFLHGFVLSLVNCVWITGAHILLFDTYIARHAQEAAMLAKTPMPDSPRLMMLLTGIFIGIVSGLVLGLFAWVAGKLLHRKRADAAH